VTACVRFPIVVYKTQKCDDRAARDPYSSRARRRRVSLMLLIPTFASEMSGVLSKLLDEQFLPLVACDNTPANSFF